MLLPRINLQRRLEICRNREFSEEEILEQVYAFLRSENDPQVKINYRLQENSSSDENSFVFDHLESNRIFHISHIKELAIGYRLRFLDARLFKSKIPAEALREIHRLEKEHQTILKGFRILAPSKHFKLENADDPILFAPIGNNYYYLIHKWGKDIHPLRKMLMWPLKSVENIAIFSFFFSFAATFLLRELFFSQYRATSEFIMLYMFSFKAVVGLILFYGIALGKNFNCAIWRSKYYNV